LSWAPSGFALADPGFDFPRTDFASFTGGFAGPRILFLKKANGRIGCMSNNAQPTAPPSAADFIDQKDYNKGNLWSN